MGERGGLVDHRPLARGDDEREQERRERAGQAGAWRPARASDASRRVAHDGEVRRGTRRRGRDRTVAQHAPDAPLALQQPRRVRQRERSLTCGGAAQRAVGEAEEQDPVAVVHVGSSANASCSRARNNRLMIVPVRVFSALAASL